MGRSCASIAQFNLHGTKEQSGGFPVATAAHRYMEPGVEWHEDPGRVCLKIGLWNICAASIASLCNMGRLSLVQQYQLQHMWSWVGVLLSL